MMRAQKVFGSIEKTALWVSFACALQVAESFIPYPVPGLRLGLANIIALVVLVYDGPRAALEVSILRTILSSLLTGTFLSPSFLLSFSAAIASTIVMIGFYSFRPFGGKFLFSIIGVSIAGALTHNLTQLYLAYILLIRHSGIFMFLPYLLIGAVFSGGLTGIIGRQVCLKLESFSCLCQEGSGQSVVSDSLSLRGFLKFMCFVALCISILAISSLTFYLVLFLCFVMFIFLRGIRLKELIVSFRRYIFLVAAAFCMHMFLNSGLHEAGLERAILASLRIISLIFVSFTLVKVLTKDEISQSLSKILLPLRFIGICEKRLACVLSVSWAIFPDFLEKAKLAILKVNFKAIRNPRHFISVCSDLVVSIYGEKI